MYNHLRSSYTAQALPKLTIEWNMNRYYDVTATNTPDEDTDGNDIERFPIESIVEPLRPVKGISKARVGASQIADDYDTFAAARHYVSDEDDKFKYWISPYMSDGSTGAIVGCQPQIVYAQATTVNKIVIKLENSWASPDDWTVDLSADGTLWGGPGMTVTNPTIRNDGQVILYWNGTSWSSTEPTTLTATKQVRGVRLTVRSLGPGVDKDGSPTTYRMWNKAAKSYTDYPTYGTNSYFSLIEISARLQTDFSSRVIDVTDTFDAGEESMLSPMGTISTNTASVTLWNSDANNFPLLSKDNPTSPYKDLVEPNAEVNLEYVYTIGGTKTSVQQFRMYVDRWNHQDGNIISMELSDYSKFLKESTPPGMMYEDVALDEIVYRLCDAVGFNNYRIHHVPENQDFVIPVWFTDGEKTVWEVLSDLAISSQSLIYFDAYGKLTVKPRKAAYNPSGENVWTLRGQKSGTELADIINLEQATEYEANLVKVNYQTTRWSKWNNGQPSLATVWEPEGVVALRAAPIIKSISPMGDFSTEVIALTPKDAKVWPYEGIVNIEGELIRYKGKQYVYYTGPNGGQRNTVWLEEADDVRKYREQTKPEHRHKNFMSGKLRITERGVYNSRESEHSDQPRDYNIRRLADGGNYTSKRGYEHNEKESRVTLSSQGVLKKPNERILMTRGNQGEVGKYRMYGTRVSFHEGSAFEDQLAGIVIHNNGSGESGYYIELSPNDMKAKAKANQHISVYSRTAKNIVGENATIQRMTDVHATDDDGRAVTGTREIVERDRDEDKKKNKKDDKKDGKKDGKKGDKDRDGKNKKDDKKEKRRKKKARKKKKPRLEYDLDIWIEQTEDNHHRIKVWLNGMEKANVVFKGEDKHAFNTKFGLYIRGKTKATFEYLYAIEEHVNLKEPPDDMSFLDRVRSGYYGTFADREIPHGHRVMEKSDKKKSTKNKNKKPPYYFDEFGAIAHEVREYDVKFTETPVQHSRLYMTNDWSAVCTRYNSTPFTAKFTVVNASRQNAVVNGGEALNGFGDTKEIEHRLHVIGRPLIIDEPEEVTRKNEDQIRSRGEIEVQFESPWIQSKAAAKVIGDWILEHWGTGVDVLNLAVFGNPLFEVGDIVAIDYPKKNMAPATSRYYVTSISTAFNFGITTSLTLRRLA